MKKSLALILAAMMVAGTATVAFANYPEVTIENGNTYYVWDKNDSRYELSTEDYVKYGDKIAIPVAGTKKDDKKEVTKNKVFPDWKVGANLVESAEIKYVKVEGASEEVSSVTMKAKSPSATLGAPLSGVTEFKLPQSFDKSISDEKFVDLLIKENGKVGVWKFDESASAIRAAFADKYEEVKNMKDGYKYMVVITLKDSTSTKVADLANDIHLGRTRTAS